MLKRLNNYATFLLVPLMLIAIVFVGYRFQQSQKVLVLDRLGDELVKKYEAHIYYGELLQVNLSDDVNGELLLYMETNGTIRASRDDSEEYLQSRVNILIPNGAAAIDALAIGENEYTSESLISNSIIRLDNHIGSDIYFYGINTDSNIDTYEIVKGIQVIKTRND